MRWARLLSLPAAVALGLAAEGHLYGWGDTRHWIPDAAVGWIVIASGLIAWWRRADSWAGPLLAGAGAAWFAGNFSAQALYLHRGPLVHLALSYPSGRAPGRLSRAAIAGGYVTAAVPSIWRSATASFVLAGLLLAVALHAHAVAAPRERVPRVASLAATAWLAALLALPSAVRLVSTSTGAASATLVAYQTGVALLAIALVIGLLSARARRAALTDLVVELGGGGTGGLRDALARALGDPTLEIGFHVPGAAGYVDASGRPLELPAEGQARRVTHVRRDGEGAVVLVHDTGTFDDRGLLEAVDVAARLSALNARLHAEVRRQVAEVDACRRRLVRAADEQRQRLEQGLREGAAHRLEDVERLLSTSHDARDSGLSAVTLQQLERAQAQLAETLADLQELGAGLHPRALSEHGLPRALASLAARSPVPVELDVPEGRFGPEVETAAYFVCSEAVANVAKHADATRISVSVRALHGALIAEVADDGNGGAVATGGGTGIRGLVDRVEAVGGSLELTSPPGGGTRVTATLPLEEDQR